MRLRSITAALLILSLLAAVLVPAVLTQDGCTETLDRDGTVSGEWAAGCTSQTTAPGEGDGIRYARFYTFTLDESSEVSIVLESSDADTYLYLREGHAKTGRVINLNDDDGGTDRSRIQEILSDGSYSIEATTYSNGESGDFTLTVSGLSGPDTRNRLVLVKEPGPGHFHHDTSRYSNGAVYHAVATDIYDVRAEALFENPHGADEGHFSYGFVLRNNGRDPAIFFIVYSSRQWRIVMEGEVIHEGAAPSLRTGKHDKNYLIVAAVGKWVSARLNGTLLRTNNGHSGFGVGSETGSGVVFVRGAG